MPKYLIKYGLGGGFGGASNEETITAADEMAASEAAWEAACEEYDSYAGLHGIRDVEQIMEEDGVGEEEAQQTYEEERERWLAYSAEEIKE